MSKQNEGGLDELAKKIEQFFRSGSRQVPLPSLIRPDMTIDPKVIWETVLTSWQVRIRPQQLFLFRIRLTKTDQSTRRKFVKILTEQLKSQYKKILQLCNATCTATWQHNLRSFKLGAKFWKGTTLTICQNQNNDEKIILDGIKYRVCFHHYKILIECNRAFNLMTVAVRPYHI